MKTDKKLTDIVKEWLSVSDLLPTTKGDYRVKIGHWFSYLASISVSPREPERANVFAYKDHLQSRDISRYTVNSYVTVVKRFYLWCSEVGYWENIGDGIKSSSVQKEYSKLPLTHEQSSNLLKSIDTSTIFGKRDYLMVQLMIFCGLRTCEVARINVQDLQKREGVPVVYIQRKGRVDKSEFVTLHQDTVEKIEDYIAERIGVKDDDPLFISHRISDHGEPKRLRQYIISRIAKKRIRDVGIDDRRITAHSLRHTFGSLMVESGVDIEVIKDMMGHTNSKTTRIYVEMAIKRKLLHSSPINDFGNSLLNNNVKE